MSKPDNHKDVSEILYQSIQLIELGNYPEAVPKDRNWVNVMGKVYSFDFTNAIRQIEDFYRNKIPEKKEFIDKRGIYDDATKLAIINNFKGYNQAIQDVITAQFNSRGEENGER